MTPSIGNSLTVLLFVIAASFLVLGQAPATDPCKDINLELTKDDILKICTLCVQTQTKTDNNTCVFFESATGQPGVTCQKNYGETSSNISYSEADCKSKYAQGPETTTTVPPPTTNATSTTTVTPITNATTTVPTTTTLTPPTTTKPTTPSTITTTVPGPTTNATSTTAAPSSKGTTTAAPSAGGGGGFSFATFLGGIVFTLAVSSLAYVVFRFYKARTERNYHTLNTNLI